ncbi:glycoside hydrolase family 15 [Kineococcus sp. TBRC 1896]|uniref:Glycoside hydrolase family 15 n=1 Tax=Kineococcus mangrovi TaxID=1660183 RepID=A0ABV4I6S3_9ACTN
MRSRLPDDVAPSLQPASAAARGGTRRHPDRRALLAGTAAGALAAGAAALWWPRSDAGALPGLRGWPGDPDWSAVADQERAWVAAGRVPGVGGAFEAMSRQALVDLRRLLQRNGSGEFPETFIAGPAGAWRYSWPRDGAFAAAAFARTGHLREAVSILAWLRAVQDRSDDGGFEARYDSTGRAPDSRHAQADGAGWAAWAVAEVLTAPGSPFQRPADLDDPGLTPAPLSPLLRRTSVYLLRQTENGARLPSPSSDYWERRERRLTLGTAAVILLGLRHAALVHDHLGMAAAARGLHRAAARQEDVVHAAFAPSGYQRYAESDGDGDGTGPCASTCFLLPPFTTAARPGVLAAWRTYQRDAARPAGGLAPGVGWKDDGISWTPEVSLVASTAAACGRHARAQHWLSWLDAHRAAGGSISEKVLPDGSPAGPAPLGWSAANVLLALDHLDDRWGPSGSPR